MWSWIGWLRFYSVTNEPLDSGRSSKRFFSIASLRIRFLEGRATAEAGGEKWFGAGERESGLDFGYESKATLSDGSIVQ